MPTTEEFLRAILPSSGLYCLTLIKGKATRQVFFKTIGELSETISASATSDWEVYHGCAAYIDTKRCVGDDEETPTLPRRTKGSVRAVKSLWLDLDSKDVLDTYGSLVSFVLDLALPPPLVVHSGHGLHAYWPLREELDRPTWERWAALLRGACEAQGLKVDRSRTCDIASILRPPGTWNRKGEPVEVICGPITGPYDLEELKGLGNVVPSPNRYFAGGFADGVLGSRPEYLGAYVPRISEALIHEPGLESIDYGLLTSNCGQFALFRESRGNISEPLWYALLGVLAFAEGGSEKAHEWSSGHPKYSRSETERRLERASELSGPTRRERIELHNAEPCRTCAFRCKVTPLEAGRPRPGVDSGFPSNELEKRPMGAGFLGSYPRGFQVASDGGVIYNEKDEDDKPKVTHVTSFPVHVASVHTGELSTDQHHYRIMHHKPHSGWHSVALKAGELAGEGVVAAMANVGVLVKHKPLFIRYMRESVELLEKRRRAEVNYEQFGWKDGPGFLYGSRLYRNSADPADCALSQQLAQRAPWLAPVPGGSVAGWKSAVDSLMGKGSEGMSFTVLASFAAPLMKFLQENEGGAIISLVTRHSGAGKSTSLEGARSVWASDKRALDLVDIDTRVSKSVALGMLCNLPATFDEFQNKDPAVTAQFLITFTNGRDKNRATQEGKLISAPATWQTMLLAAGNQSLVDTIKSGGGTDAPAMRILEFPVESSGSLKPSELMAIADTLRANSGHAGDAYLRFLVQAEVIDWVKHKLPEMMDEITEKCGFGKEHRFWARALSAIGVASLIVNKLQLVSFSPERIIDWGMAHFGQLAANGDGTSKSMLGHLASFLSEKLDETLHMPGPSKGRFQVPPIGEVPRRKICVRIEHDSYTCWIAERELRIWLEKNSGGGFSTLLSELKSQGLLVSPRRSITLGAGSSVATGQVYAIGFQMDAPSFSGTLKEVKALELTDPDYVRRKR